MNDLLKEINTLLGENASEATGESNSAILQHLALAATVSGVDLDDDEALGDFMKKVKDVVTKERGALRAQLRRWTASKARTTVKAAKGAL